MKRFRPHDFFGPTALALVVLAGVGALRGLENGSSAFAEPQGDDSFRDTVLRDSDLTRAPGFRSTANSVPGFLNAGSQRVEQLDVMREVLYELRMIRQLIQNGDTRVNVASVELDYDRLSDAISRSMPASKAGASSVTGKSGGVRRLTRGQDGAEESND